MLWAGEIRAIQSVSPNFNGQRRRRETDDKRGDWLAMSGQGEVRAEEMRSKVLCN